MKQTKNPSPFVSTEEPFALRPFSILVIGPFPPNIPPLPINIDRSASTQGGGGKLDRTFGIITEQQLTASSSSMVFLTMPPRPRPPRVCHWTIVPPCTNECGGFRESGEGGRENETTFSPLWHRPLHHVHASHAVDLDST